MLEAVEEFAVTLGANMDDIHNLGFDLVRATEQTALRAGRWVGLGDRARADEVGTAAMMAMLDMAPMTGYLLDSEARKAGYHAQQDSRKRVGAGGPAMDLVVDAIDGVGLLAQGRPGAIAVACAAPRGTIWSPAPAIYMEKIVVDREVGAALVAECMDAPAAWTLALVARLKHKSVRDLVVFVLDRPRHSNLIDDIRRGGRAGPGAPRWRRGRCAHGGHAGQRHRRAHGDRRRAGRGDRGSGGACPGRRDAGPAGPAER